MSKKKRMAVAICSAVAFVFCSACSWESSLSGVLQSSPLPTSQSESGNSTPLPQSESDTSAAETPKVNEGRDFVGLKIPPPTILELSDYMEAQVEKFAENNQALFRELAETAYATGIVLEDVTGDDVPEICLVTISNWDRGPLSAPPDDGSFNTTVYSLETGSYMGEMSGDVRDFRYFRTGTGEIRGYMLEENISRIYCSGPDIFHQAYILWEVQQEEGIISTTPKWLYMYQSQELDYGEKDVTEYSILEPNEEDLQEFRMNSDKSTEKLVSASTPGLAPQIQDFLKDLVPLPASNYYYASIGVDGILYD